MMVDQRNARLQLETDRHRIAGTLALARDGYRSRISDMLNATERDFISLTDVFVEPLDGSAATRHAFLALARSKIVFATTVEE